MHLVCQSWSGNLVSYIIERHVLEYFFLTLKKHPTPPKKRQKIPGFFCEPLRLFRIKILTAFVTLWSSHSDHYSEFDNLQERTMRNIRLCLVFCVMHNWLVMFLRKTVVIILMMGSDTLGKLRLLKLNVGLIYICCRDQTANYIQCEVALSPGT